MIDVLYLTIGPTCVHARLLIGSGEPRPGANTDQARLLPRRTGPFRFPIEDDASSTDFSQWNMAHSLPPASLAIDHSSLATCHSPLATIPSRFCSFHLG